MRRDVSRLLKETAILVDKALKSKKLLSFDSFVKIAQIVIAIGVFVGIFFSWQSNRRAERLYQDYKTEKRPYVNLISVDINSNNNNENTADQTPEYRKKSPYCIHPVKFSDVNKLFIRTERLLNIKHEITSLLK